MNYIFYIGIAIGLIGVIGKLFNKEKFTFKNESSFHRMYYLGYFSLLFLILSLTHNENKYHTSTAELARRIERIPIIEKDMYLISRTKDSEKWVNRGKPRHFKELKIGRYDINKETDYFINAYEKQTLIIEFKSSSLFSKKSKKYFFNKAMGWDDFKGWTDRINNKKFPITEKMGDSILTKWGYNLDSLYYKR